MTKFKLLMTPDEVISLAFPPHTGLSADSIPETVILSCQEKYLRPVVNELFVPLLEGGYASLLDDYLKPSLALYVKYALVPHLACSFGDLGITVLKSPSLEPCPPADLADLRKWFLAEARELVRRAVEHIEADPDSYPEYDPRLNILHFVNISSQFVL